MINLDYASRNSGKTLRRYKITRPGAKHVRREPAANGGSVAVIYGCPTPSDDIGLKIHNKIIFTEEDAKKYAHMQLVEVPMHDAPIEITTEGNVSLGTPTPKATLEVKSQVNPTQRIDVPERWFELPISERKRMASAIVGSPVRKAPEADAIIGDYVRGSVNA